MTDESLSQLFAYILHVQEGKHNNNQTLLQCGITRKGIEAVVEKAEGSCWLFFWSNNRTHVAIIQNLYVQITYSLSYSRVTL